MSDNELKNKREDEPEVEDFDDFSSIHKPENNFQINTDSDNSADKNKKSSSAFCKTLCIVVALLVVFVIAFGAYGAFVPQDKILGGITVSGVEIGGLDISEALNELNSSDSALKSEVVIVANGKRFVVKTDEIDAVLDIEATVDKAFKTAKSDNIFANAFDSVKIKLSGGEILPVINFNEEKFSKKINEIGKLAVGSQLVEHSVRFDGDGLGFIVPGISGYNNDPAPVMAMIKDALLKSESTEIEVNFKKTKPAKMTVEMLESLVNSDPVDASFALENGGVKIIEAVEGRIIDKSECKKVIDKVTEGGQEIKFSYNSTEPQLRSEDVRNKLFNGELGSYTTRYAPGGNRGSNVAIAASKINGSIVLPGETFSFNKTVGRRSVANGFKPAPEYQNGQTVTGIGGGTCQVSTTLYSAVLYADIKVVKRSNHSMSVSYVPLGQDATVTDGGIDLQFKNDTKFPLKISAVTGGGKITVKIIGTKPDSQKTVKISHKSAGGGIRTTRYVYDADGKLIKEEDMGLSKYKPHSEDNENSSPAPSPVASEAPAEGTGAETSESEAVQAPDASTTEAPIKTESDVEVTTKEPSTVTPVASAIPAENGNVSTTPMKSEG